MNPRLFFILVGLLAALGPAIASAQQRVEFERKKFDRSRFERPDPTVRPPLPVPAAETTEPVTALPMVTEKTIPVPDEAAPEFATPAAPAAEADAANPATTSPTNTAIFSTNSTLPRRPPLNSPYPATATPEEKAVIDTPLLDQIPAKWFNSAKDHAELVELQKKTGACMVVYFKNPSVMNEKGLCAWFEKAIMNDIAWRKAMKYYLKLEIMLPGNKLVDELAAQYRAGRTPAFFVIKPGNSRGPRIQLFEYAAGARPKPLEAKVVVESIKAASTPAYQTLF